VVVLGTGVEVFVSVALDVVAVPVLDRPGTLSITDPPLTGVETVAFVVEVEAVPIPGSLSVILEVPAEGEYSERK